MLLRSQRVLRNILSYCNYKKIIRHIACFLCFTTLAVAGDDIIGIDASFQFGGVRTSSLDDGIIGFGGRAGYYLGSIVFLDGEIFHEPEKLKAAAKKTIVLGGLRLGTVFDDTIGVFGKARFGTIKFDAKSQGLLPEDADFHPVIDLGIIIERYYQRNFFIRLDVGDYIIPFGDTKTPIRDGTDTPGNLYHRLGTTHNPAIEFGMGIRF